MAIRKERYFMSIAKKLMVAVLLVSGSVFGANCDKVGQAMNKKLTEFQTMVCCGIATTFCCFGCTQCPAGSFAQVACYLAAAGIVKFNADINKARTETYNNPDNYINKQPSAIKKK